MSYLNYYKIDSENFYVLDRSYNSNISHNWKRYINVCTGEILMVGKYDTGKSNLKKLLRHILGEYVNEKTDISENDSKISEKNDFGEPLWEID